MSNYHLQPADKPQALTPQALRSLRQDPVQGISRRTLLRRSIGGATLLWLTEVAAGSIGFLWPNAQGRLRRHRSRSGRSPTSRPQNSSLPFATGFPVYYQAGAGLHRARRPVAPGVRARRGHDRRRHRAQRPRAVPALPAPRLQAQPVPQELLVGVPLPRLALRPPRDQGRRARSTARRRAAWTASRSPSTPTAS